MAYTKINWQDSPSTSTPITANNLNKMDNGIASADLGITTLNTNLNATNTRVGTLSNLNTTNKTNLVSGINEVNTKIGSLSALTTLKKSNVITAVNEVNAKATPITNTFTPTLRGSINPGYFTYTKREGRYYKVGDIVFFDIELILASCTSIPTGFVQITGIPFAVKYQGNCQSVYVNGKDYRKINAWRLIPGDNSKVFLTAQSYVPGTLSSTLFGLEFGSNPDNVTVTTGVQNSTIILSGIYLQKK